MEYELEAILHYTFRRHGCNDAGWAYPSIVASGANACILHYTENNQSCADGDMVLIDAGGEFQFYAADITRCFPVNGHFSPAQRRVYEWVLKAQEEAIAAVQAGNSFHQTHEVASRVLCQGLLDLGVLTGTLEDIVSTQSFKRYTIHNTSHWLGLDVHDCGAYYQQMESRLLEPGMVLTVEPGLYFSPDDPLVPEEFRGIGIRIEDDVAVTGGNPEVLTAATPKSVEAIEDACAQTPAALPRLDCLEAKS